MFSMKTSKKTISDLDENFSEDEEEHVAKPVASSASKKPLQKRVVNQIQIKLLFKS